MSQDSKGSFYEPNTKLISDPNTAHTLANTEANLGVNAALKQEAVLKQEHDTGLTELQEKNISVISGLKEKYPFAFQEKITKSGETVYIIDKPEITGQNDSFKAATNPSSYVEMWSGLMHNGDLGENGKFETNIAFTKDGALYFNSEKGWNSYISEYLDKICDKIKGTNTDEGTTIDYANTVSDITKIDPSFTRLLKFNLVMSNNFNKSEAEKQKVSHQQDAADFLTNF